MFDLLTSDEVAELSDKLCSALHELRHWFCFLPGYAPLLAELDSIESELKPMPAIMVVG